MAKINKHIEIVASNKSGLSSMGQKSRRGIQAVLAAHYTDVRITVVDGLPDLEALVSRRPDLVFLGMKFIPEHPALGPYGSGKIWIGRYLDDHGIVYTGSAAPAHMLELNKGLAKRCVVEAGLRTARFHIIRKGQIPSLAGRSLNYPVFIKPTDRGGGLGIDSASLAYNVDQLSAKIRSLAAEFHADSLIEEYLPGREFSVGILEAVDGYAVMPIELVAPVNDRGARFLSAEVKLADTERNLEVTDEALKAELNELALDVFHALGGRDYGRIDIRLDSHGTPHFLEANLLPSLLEGYGNFPKTCLLNLGLHYGPMVLQIVDLAFARNITVTDENLAEATPLHRTHLHFHRGTVTNSSF